jgi:hypothetical protein
MSTNAIIGLNSRCHEEDMWKGGTDVTGRVRVKWNFEKPAYN